MTAVRDRTAMIAGMAPQADAETYHFCTVAEPVAALHFPEALAVVREAEGVSLILPEAAMRRHGLPADQPMRRITLGVQSALDGVGLTAAVAAALAAHDIACNMVAGYHHDHVFVPEADADRALAILHDLAAREGGA
ncbi:MAG: ACT domain-containing protein [Roseovarius sp.]|nr:ACT domain-containing protein [Roseovarius sp.]